MKDKAISILGMGYAGLPLGLVLANAGFRVIGYDTNKQRIDDLKAGKIHFFEEGMQRYLDRLLGSYIFFTSSVDDAKGDIYIVTVGTPLIAGQKKPNLDYIGNASRTIGSLLKKGDLVILRSTVPVGCTKDVVLPVLEKFSGLRGGRGFYLAFAGERTAEGMTLKELVTNPVIIGGFDHVSYSLAANLFHAITPTVINVGSLEAAEMCKLLDNTFRDHLFAYVNNMTQLAEKIGVDLNKLINAVNFGYSRNHIPRISPGVGGPCLSKDPYILASVFEKHNLSPKLIITARKVNENGPILIKEKLASLLRRAGKSIENARITLVGMAFKGEPETSDLRGSTSLSFLSQLPNKNNVRAYDPVVSDDDIKGLGIKPVSLGEGFSGADAVVVLNNHRSYARWDLKALLASMDSPAVFIDTWYNFNPLDLKNHNGILYGGLGND